MDEIYSYAPCCRELQQSSEPPQSHSHEWNRLKMPRIHLIRTHPLTVRLKTLSLRHDTVHSQILNATCHMGRIRGGEAQEGGDAFRMRQKLCGTTLCKMLGKEEV